MRTHSIFKFEKLEVSLKLGYCRHVIEISNSNLSMATWICDPLPNRNHDTIQFSNLAQSCRISKAGFLNFQITLIIFSQHFNAVLGKLWCATLLSNDGSFMGKSNSSWQRFSSWSYKHSSHLLSSRFTYCEAKCSSIVNSYFKINTRLFSKLKTKSRNFFFILSHKV